MPRYFFNLRNDGFVPDTVGKEFAGDDAARTVAWEVARLMPKGRDGGPKAILGGRRERQDGLRSADFGVAASGGFRFFGRAAVLGQPATFARNHLSLFCLDSNGEEAACLPKGEAMNLIWSDSTASWQRQ